MNDVELTLRNLETLIDTVRSDLTFTQKAGLYGGLHAILKELEEFVDEEHGGDGYAHEKLENVRWSVAAILGFDINNRHGDEEHRGWAIGALWTLKSLLVPPKA